MIKRYKTRDELLENHKGAAWEQYGPILKYGDEEFVQVYPGGHVWIIVSVKDPTLAYWCDGYEGDEFGWGFVPELPERQWKPEGFPKPQRTGKPITHDALLFADKEKIVEYLGPEDPISKEFED